MTFVDFGRRVSPTVLQGEAGSAFRGVLTLVADLQADAQRSALRAPYPDDAVGPAYDALTLLGSEYELPRYPGEDWPTYHARLAAIWEDAQAFASTQGLLAQLHAAGFTGVEIKTAADWPTVPPTDYWSQFWLWFPVGTHDVVSDETQVVTTETGDFVSYDAEGLTLEKYRTLQSIIARHKPGHWVCRGGIFDDGVETDVTLLPNFVTTPA